MKKVKLFSFALAALMLGACSSEDGIDNGGQGTVLPGEKGYISLAICRQHQVHVQMMTLMMAWRQNTK